MGNGAWGSQKLAPSATDAVLEEVRMGPLNEMGRVGPPIAIHTMNMRRKSPTKNHASFPIR